MEALRKAVRRSPNIFKGKHKKLGEGWAENQDTVSDGITFYLKHLGSTLMDELEDGESYSGTPSARAVAGIVAMAKSAGKKLRKVSLCVSYRGVNVIDLITQDNILDVSIYRISFCTADKHHDKVFAFMSRNKVNETIECHAFLCAKRKIAQAVTLTVSQAFNLAKEVTETRTRLRSHSESLPGSPTETETESDPFSTIRSLDSSSKNINLPVLTQSSNAEPVKLAALYNNNDINAHKWEKFDDSQEMPVISKSWDDDFSKLAEDRLRPTYINHMTLMTDLCNDEVDASVHMYQNNPDLCLQELNRTPSVDDLLNL